MKSRVTVAVLFVTLAGCSALAPLQQDQPLLLAPGHGVAAVQFDTQTELHQVVVAGADGTKLRMSTVPEGKSLFLFEVPAGKYCLTQFYLQSVELLPQDGGEDCFVVPAGQLGFSGMLVPGSTDRGIEVQQHLNLAEAAAQLRERYPLIAKQFLPAEAPPVAAPVARTTLAPVAATRQAPPPAKPGELISSWTTDDEINRSQTIMLRNNTQWPLKIASYELKSCINVKQPCKPTAVDFRLAPHEIKAFMTVQGADPQGPYSYEYHFQYGFDTAPPAAKPKSKSKKNPPG